MSPSFSRTELQSSDRFDPVSDKELILEYFLTHQADFRELAATKADSVVALHWQ